MSHVDSEPPRLPDGTPDPVRDLVATAMAKDPADRFPDAGAMADAADAIADRLAAGLPVAPVPRRRSGRAAAVVLAVLVLVVLCVLLSFLMPTPSSPSAAPYDHQPGGPPATGGGAAAATAPARRGTDAKADHRKPHKPPKAAHPGKGTRAHGRR
jgi:serine/threonine-protein kinase